MLKEDIERFNEWWFTEKIRKELALPFHRHAFPRIIENLKERQILLITGPRRVGKTTLLYQTIEKLLEKISPNRLLYFSFEEASANPKEVLEFYEKKILMKPFEAIDKAYIFFDEIQYVENWPTTLKQFYDLYPNLKFFLSGSSSLLLSKDAVEKLAGRFFTIQLKPLTFLEFLELKGLKISQMEVFSRRMEAYFHDYLRKSGFPEIANWENDAKIAEYIRNSVIDRVTLRDIPLIFKTRDMMLMEKTLKLILSKPGITININALSRAWGESKITISNYLKYLETSLLIRSLSNFRPSYMSSSRKLKKYYPITPSLIFSHSKENFEHNFGAVLETYVTNALGAQHYFRKGKKEIDIILLKNRGILPIEVKETANETDIKKFSRLMRRINAKEGWLITLNQEAKRENIKIIPAYMVEQFLTKQNLN